MLPKRKTKGGYTLSERGKGRAKRSKNFGLKSSQKGRTGRRIAQKPEGAIFSENRRKTEGTLIQEYEKKKEGRKGGKKMIFVQGKTSQQEKNHELKLEKLSRNRLGNQRTPKRDRKVSL